MAIIDFGGVKEEVVTREEFPLSKAKEVLKNEVVAILGYGPQGYGQSLNMRDAGISIIVGQRKGGKGWNDAVKDGWMEGKNLFSKIEDAVDKATIIQYLAFGCRAKRAVADCQAAFEKRAGTLFFTRLFDRVQRSNKCYSPAGC